MTPTTDSTTTREPIAATEAVRLVIVATFAVTTSFDVWTPTPEQTGSLLGLFAAVSVLLSVFARRRSTPTAQVALTVAQADALSQ
jgi:hypothetical protein